MKELMHNHVNYITYIKSLLNRGLITIDDEVKTMLANYNAKTDIKPFYEEAYLFWDSSRNSDDAQTQSHWRGHGVFNDETWYKIGREDLERVIKFTGISEFGDKTFMDYGSGGGTKLCTAARMFQKVIGVDISNSNLEECRKQLTNHGLGNFELCHIDIANPMIQLEPYRGKVDILLCTAVIYHMPGKEYVRRILGVFKNLLSDTGMAIVQYREQGGKYRDNLSDYRRNLTSITAHTRDEFYKDAMDAGFKTCEFKDYIEKIQYQYCLLKKRDMNEGTNNSRGGMQSSG